VCCSQSKAARSTRRSLLTPHAACDQTQCRSCPEDSHICESCISAAYQLLSGVCIGEACSLFAVVHVFCFLTVSCPLSHAHTLTISLQVAPMSIASTAKRSIRIVICALRGFFLFEACAYRAAPWDTPQSVASAPKSQAPHRTRSPDSSPALCWAWLCLRLSSSTFACGFCAASSKSKASYANSCSAARPKVRAVSAVVLV
jgi:hypothetical protein